MRTTRAHGLRRGCGMRTNPEVSLVYIADVKEIEVTIILIEISGIKILVQDVGRDQNWR